MENSFQNEKLRAIEQLHEMNRRALNKAQKNETDFKSQKSTVAAFAKSINIPPDVLLILGLIFVLSQEKCDKWLVLALVFLLV